jgi:hypothetical protein
MAASEIYPSAFYIFMFTAHSAASKISIDLPSIALFFPILVMSAPQGNGPVKAVKT